MPIMSESIIQIFILCVNFLIYNNKTSGYLNMDKSINQQILLNYVRDKGISKQFQVFFCSQKIPKQLKLTKLTSEIMDELCEKINEKTLLCAVKSKGYRSQRSDKWIMGEFKLYIWVSVFYAYNSSIAIQQMKQIDLQFIQSFFPSKSTLKLKYELLCLFPSQAKRRNWEIQQIQLVKKLVEKDLRQHKRIQWKKVSYDLYVESEGIFFKNFAQCREMWTNHLDQTINKSMWTKEEDYKLLILAQQENKSWAKISKKFNQKRTDHMIKNRYKSLIKLSKRYNIRMNDRQAENKMIKMLACKIQKLKNGTSKSDKLKEKVNLDTELQEKEVICQSSDIKSFEENSEIKANSNQDYLKQWEELELIKASCSLPKSESSQSYYQMEDKYLDLKMLDLTLCEIPRQFSSTDDLLQKLGCSHIQQIESAFQQCYNGKVKQFY